MSDSIDIFVYAPEEMPELFKSLVQRKEGDGFRVVVSQSADEINENIKKNGCGVVLFAFKKKPALIEVVKVCKTNVREMKKDLVKVMGYNLSGSSKADKILTKVGCSELFDDFLTARAFEHKMNLWVRGMKSNVDKVIASSQSYNQKNGNQKEAKEESKQGSGSNIICTPELNFASDCWLINHKSHIRYIMGSWIVELTGPGPYVGRWDKMDEDPSGMSWKWIPMHEEIFLFIEHEGSWCFRGKKPEFQNDTNRWQFVSKSPLLYFSFMEEQDPLYKFKIEDNKFAIAKNSKYAVSKKDKLIESADPKIAIAGDDITDGEKQGISELEARKKEQEGEGKEIKVDADGRPIDSANLSGKFAAEAGIETNLRGKVKNNEAIDNSPMFGKVSEESEEFGESEDVAGGFSTVEIEKKALSPNIGGSANEEGDLGGNLTGKSRTEGIDHSPMGAAVKMAETGSDGPLSGKSSTEAIDGSPLSSKVSKQYEKASGPMFGKVGEQEDIQDGPLLGKSSTDAIDGSPLSSKVSKQYDKASGPMFGKAGEQEDIQDGTLSGKSSTDAIDGSPLSGKVGEQNEKAKEPMFGKVGEQDDSEDGPLSGKSNTDAIDGSPMSGKVGEQDEKAKGPMFGKVGEQEDSDGPLSGKSSTDAIDGSPLKGKSATDEVDRAPLFGKVGDEGSEDVGIDPDAPMGKAIPAKGARKNAAPAIGSIANEKENLDEFPLKGKLGKQANGKDVPLPGEIPGKSATDKVDRSPLFGKVGEESSEDVGIDPDAQMGKNISAQKDQKARKNSAPAIGGIANEKEGLDGEDILADDNQERSGLIGKTGEIKSKNSGNTTIDPHSKEITSKESIAQTEGETLIPKEEMTQAEKEMISALDPPSQDDLELDDTPSSIDQLDLSSIDLALHIQKIPKNGEAVAGAMLADIDDIEETVIVVTMPAGGYVAGDKVNCRVECQYSGSNVDFLMSGSVLELNDYDDENSVFDIELDDYDDVNLQRLKSVFAERQKNIHHFMKLAKG